MKRLHVHKHMGSNLLPVIPIWKGTIQSNEHIFAGDIFICDPLTF